MSTTEITVAGVGQPSTAPPRAAQLAARIQIPRRLPPRYDGQPLQHLSHSSYSRFVLCPEDWRRRYMLGEKTAPSGSMFLGREVDDAITLYYRHILDHGEHLSVDQIKDAFWDGWKAATEAERERLGIAWETDLREDRAFKLGLDAVELTFSQLIPHLGEPVAVQRKMEYTLAPGLEWSVVCYLDLETPDSPPNGEESRFYQRARGQVLRCALPKDEPNPASSSVVEVVDVLDAKGTDNDADEERSDLPRSEGADRADAEQRRPERVPDGQRLPPVELSFQLCVACSPGS